MSTTIELPLWLFILVMLLAAVTFLSRLLVPSVRWFFRRRMERFVSDLNQRLPRPIEPFRLARRFDTVQRLTYDSAVLDAVEEHAAQEGIPKDVALERANAYAREIVPSFAATLYFRVAIRAARALSKFLYAVKLDRDSAAVIDQIDPEATVIFVMNHRSNMDYVLVTYLVADNSAPSYAVGEWARIWPLSSLIRAMGAYFIRRRSRNDLYRRVLARYVQIATEAGVTQAVFPEGGLSLDGRTAPAKLGLLSYIVSGFDQERSRDVVFVPVALAYDRVLEDRVLTEAAARGARRFRASIPTAVWFAVRYLWGRIVGSKARFGTAGVRFGVPLSLREHLSRASEPALEALGEALTTRIDAAMPVLPVPVVASILEQHAGVLARDHLVSQAVAMLSTVEGAAFNGTPQAAIESALDALLRREILVETGAGIAYAPGQAAIAAFYAASIQAKNGNNPR
ncbi:MAG: 1-acyl-sn-glycerol-3-phosphate acyltransferase [Pseudomonadota bacterium]